MCLKILFQNNNEISKAFVVICDFFVRFNWLYIY